MISSSRLIVVRTSKQEEGSIKVATAAGLVALVDSRQAGCCCINCTASEGISIKIREARRSTTTKRSQKIFAVAQPHVLNRKFKHFKRVGLRADQAGRFGMISRGRRCLDFIV